LQETLTSIFAIKKKTFTGEQVKEFQAKFPIKQVDGHDEITGNPTTLDEHIYYRLIHSALIMSWEEGRRGF